MLAIAWPRQAEADYSGQRLSRRLGMSLCAGIGGKAGTAEVDGLHLAYRTLRPANGTGTWRPSILPNGHIVVFHGYFDNASDIAAQLGTDARDLARLYGLAVDQWGD